VKTNKGEFIQGEQYRDQLRRELAFIAVQFDGLLEVEDPERFMAAIHQGIGPGKGFGFGLLSLALA
jgi:CRISPR-associated protein Cas6/Cse3/CasE subtype I-E